MTNHTFAATLRWRGNLGTGTSSYRAYSRDYELSGPLKTSAIAGSSAKTYRGDDTRFNPEELLVAALSSCHMLAYLHLCADAGIVVTAYDDSAEGTMRTNPDGSGEFVEVTLRPRVQMNNPARSAEAAALHQRAHEVCFIARSVNFPVLCEATTTLTPTVAS
jgi:organic hydroperoxide reductase OsmC/OhrA